MSELRVGARVHGRDGEAGTLDALVIDPTSQRVTHLVVLHDKLGPRLLVDADQVRTANPSQVDIDLDEESLHTCAHFDEPAFNAPDDSYAFDDVVLDPGSYFLEPFASPLDGWNLASHERVPKGEITMRRHAPVHTRDGTKVGQVDEFLVDPADGHITHLVVREGRLRRTDVVVPISAATQLDDEHVTLQLDLTELEALEHIPVRRHHHLREDSV